MPATRAPNRLLDLAELDRPDYRRVLDSMDDLLRRDGRCYLHPSKRWEYPWALERAQLREGERVLDAGCGASIFPVWLARQGLAVSALDLEIPGRLDLAYAAQVHYVRGGLTALPYAEASFDAAFCISVIEHLPREAMLQALSELRRVLRPGGRLLLTTDYYEDAGAQLWYEGPAEQFPVDWSFFDEQRLRDLLRNAGGLELLGELDLTADWGRIRPRMRRFHGYPYTSVGLALARRGK